MVQPLHQKGLKHFETAYPVMNAFQNAKKYLNVGTNQMYRQLHSVSQIEFHVPEFQFDIVVEVLKRTTVRL